MPGDQGFDGAVFGREGQDADAVTPFSLCPDVIGFWEKPARIERRDVDRQRLREDRVRDGLILKSEACREHHAASDLGANRRQALEQIERGKAFHKSAGDGCENFAIPGLCSMSASIGAAAGMSRPRCARMCNFAGMCNFKHRNHHQP